MDPAGDLNISNSGEDAPAEAPAICADQEQRALAVALAAEFGLWAAPSGVAETGDGKPGEYWAEQWPPTRGEPEVETLAGEAIDLAASVPTPGIANR
jgi:hypothetical protein